MPLSRTHAWTRREVVVVEAEAASHRLPVGQVEQLRGGHPAGGEVEQFADDREHRVGLAQRAVGEADAQIGCAGVALDDAERRLDQRCERLDVRAHHDHVARLERGIALQLVQDRVAQDLDLSRPAVAGVDADALVGLVGGRRPVGADVGLDAGEQRVGARVDRVVVILGLAPEHQLHLARVTAPRGEQPVLRQPRRVVLGPPARARCAAQPLPQRGRGMQEEQVHVAAGRQRTQDLQPRRREPGQPEQREPRRQVDELRLLREPRAARLEPLGRARLTQLRAQASPQLGLPSRLLPGRPRAHHLRPLKRVAVKQPGDVPDAAEPPRAVCNVPRQQRIHGSSMHSSTTSSNGHTARSGRHRSLSGAIPDATASASSTSFRGNGNSTFAHTPSLRPGVAPRCIDSRCVSQRSMPRVGTAMTSGANGSSSGRQQPAQGSISPSARSALWM